MGVGPDVPGFVLVYFTPATDNSSSYPMLLVLRVCSTMAWKGERPVSKSLVTREQSLVFRGL